MSTTQGVSAALDEKQKKAVARIAGLTIVNAMVFQEVLAASDGRVHPLRQSLATSDPVTELAQHWDFIEANIDYVPIFKVARRLLLALPADADVEDAIRFLGDRALEIVSKKAALRHDLMGRVYHRLLAEAKYLGTYYTSVPAATFLAKLALRADTWDRDLTARQSSRRDLSRGCAFFWSPSRASAFGRSESG